MTTSTLVLVGPHGVGKSTLGAALADHLGVPFHGEIGRELGHDPSWRADGTTAAHAQQAFDHEVFGRELARDAAAPAGRVVETWHPGNLAFAARRSPAAAAAWLPAVRAACARSNAWVVPLFATVDTLRQRQSEPGDLTFFIGVGHSARRWACQLGLRVLPPLFTEAAPPEALAATVARRITRLSQRTPRRGTSPAQPWS